MLETCKQTKKPVNTLLHYDSATLYSLSDFIVFYVPVITIINIIHLVLFAKLNHESIHKNHMGQLVDVCNSTIGKIYWYSRNTLDRAPYQIFAY